MCVNECVRVSITALSLIINLVSILTVVFICVFSFRVVFCKFLFFLQGSFCSNLYLRQMSETQWSDLRVWSSADQEKERGREKEQEEIEGEKQVSEVI